jgi:hypothetical protein
MTKTLNKSELAQFTGSESWYRHGINRKVLSTDGAKFVADQAGDYWLIDEIAIIQAHDKRVAAEEFQVWKLAVNADQTGVLTCDDGNDHVIFSKQIASYWSAGAVRAPNYLCHTRLARAASPAPVHRLGFERLASHCQGGGCGCDARQYLGRCIEPSYKC